MVADSSRGPLAGVTVVDLTRVLSGPYCTMLLADMGARVIKVELPGSGDDTRAWGPPFVGGESSYFLSVNRNKESVALDFKSADGRAVLDRLIARADVLVENFRPGTLARQGLDYASLAATYPRLIYASLSGYGQSGPRAAEPGYDAVLQGEGGLMGVTGAADGPAFRLGVAVADIVTGMFAAQGVMLALLARQTSGRGQMVDVAMLDSVAALLTYQAGIVFATGESPGRMGNRHPSIAPYDTFETADGPMVLAIGNDDQWRRFCAETRLDSLAGDPRFATNAARVEHYDSLAPQLRAVLSRQTREEWTVRLVAAGVPCGPVRTVEEALSDAQLAARGMIQRLTHATAGPISVLGVPVKLSETPGTVRTPPPTLGQHTSSVLEELGLRSTTMETSDVRRRIKESLDRARARATERRAANAKAEAAFEVFLQRAVVPVFQQAAGALKAEGYAFTLNTPAGSVRLVSEKSSSDFIDLRLDTTAQRPQVLVSFERLKGRERTSEEQPLRPGTLVENLTEQDVLDAVAGAIEVLIDR